ncbi:hypothetical protein HMPREF2822_12300 [Corynebacterium sp. HMSC062E11]|uniref:hypothetical protein n=1 Tax=Corynebacterium sp. HMSC062E11 TaxID=1739326 RepID=UPI0008A5AE11|nr:hypothetical protein [Corynebacterium sp. HMSC062E11]OFK27217.1 hypothetical protein HMPREF2822_12300 [Corynebacterium sp. HMSC062E11]
MTNFDRAAQVIYDEASKTWERGEILTAAGEAERLANALADAGLLAPDLPEANDAGIIVPGGKGWLPQGLTGPSVWTAPGGRVMVQRVEPGDLTPAEARFFALAVLAAAQYAKGEA